MKSYPIIFSGPMVRAILEGRKTQTRRVVKPRNSYFDGGSWPRDVVNVLFKDWGNAWVDEGPSPAGNPGPYLHLPLPELGTTHRIYPRWQPGDLLWAREKWRFLGVDMNRLGRTHYHEDVVLEFAADGKRETIEVKWDIGEALLKTHSHWRPSIHMPRWASRITLKVEDVRVERLQEISLNDVEVEGIAAYTFARGVISESPPDPRWKFIELWDSVNAKRGFEWASNPWVWVIQFKIQKILSPVPEGISQPLSTALEGG